MPDMPASIRYRMQAILGREPSPTELAEGERMGPEVTAMTIMNARRGVSTTPPVPPSDMSIFDQSLPRPVGGPVPGVSLSYNPMLPGSRPAPPIPVPPPPPVDTPPPIPMEAAEPAIAAPEVAQKSILDKITDLVNAKDKKTGEDSPTMKGLDEIAKGLTPKINPAAAAEAAKISPIQPDMQAAAGMQAAQALMAQIMASKKRMGTTLTGRPFG